MSRTDHDAADERVLVVQVVSPEGEVWAGRASSVRAPVLGGALGVLPGHQPLLCLVGRGTLRLHRLDGGPVDLVVDGGFLSVDHDVVTVIADSATTTDGTPSGRGWDAAATAS